MKTTENNKLIAEFMGYPYFLSDSGVDSWGDDDVERWEIGIDNYCTIEQLLFHSSWDWLMPVVIELESTKNHNGHKYNFGISNHRCRVSNYGKIILDTGDCQTKIIAVYKAVVELIRNHNKTRIVIVNK